MDDNEDMGMIAMRDLLPVAVDTAVEACVEWMLQCGCSREVLDLEKFDICDRIRAAVLEPAVLRDGIERWYEAGCPEAAVAGFLTPFAEAGVRVADEYGCSRPVRAAMPQGGCRRRTPESPST